VRPSALPEDPAILVNFASAAYAASETITMNAIDANGDLTLLMRRWRRLQLTCLNVCFAVSSVSIVLCSSG
jgi:hypothetical protein